MKQILFGLLVVVLIGGTIVAKILDDGSTIYAENPSHVEPEEPEELPEWMTDTEAVDAAKEVVRRKELEAEEKRLEAEIEALSASLAEVQKELGSY